MAMEKLGVIKETHNKPITALSYNPMKHEILVGFEGTKGILLFATSMKSFSVPFESESSSLAEYLYQRFYCPF